jgi:hypothetical protein
MLCRIKSEILATEDILFILTETPAAFFCEFTVSHGAFRLVAAINPQVTIQELPEPVATERDQKNVKPRKNTQPEEPNSPDDEP